jgi:hypothetical protein
MHVKMQDLCDQVASENPGLPRVDYGCIIYGDISQMASDTDSTLNWVPTQAIRWTGTASTSTTTAAATRIWLATI